MADLLIRIRDKESSGDAETDALQFGRGDVIAVWETPGPWGKQELSNPDWRIVRLANVTAADALELIQPETDALATSERLMRKRRAGFNLDNLPAGLRAWLDDDDSRAEPIRTVNLSRAAFLVLVQVKARRAPFRVL
jgi:hypothetical protein